MNAYVYWRILNQVAEVAVGEGLREEIEVDESVGIYGDGTSWADDTAFSLSGPCPERLLQKASSVSALVLSFCEAHGMKRNVLKFKHPKGPLPEVKRSTFLGLGGLGGLGTGFVSVS